jgi:hypothetical protein
MERYLRSLSFFVAIGILVIIMSLLAVPYIYGGKDIKDYIENNIVVPGGKRIKVNSDIGFSVFPKIKISIDDADIIDRVGLRNKISKFTATVGFFDTLTGNMRIKYAGLLNGNGFKGKLSIADYYAMQRRQPTNFKLRLDAPFVLELNGKFQLKENEISLREYSLFHKSTKVSGDIILTRLSDQEFNFVNHISVVSDNLDDLRRLYNFDQFNEPYSIIRGSGRMNFTFTAKGDSVFALKRNLNGQGSIRIKDTNIYGYELEEIVNNPLSIKFLPDEDRFIPIESVTGVFIIENGVVKTEDFSIKSKQANLVSGGSYDIASEKIDVALNLNANLSNSKINLPLIIRGDASAPRVIGNFAGAVTAGGGNAVAIQQNLENITTLVNEKIIQNLATGDIAPDGAKQNNGVFDEILPWQKSGGAAPVQRVEPARIISAQEEDELIGNWGAPAQPQRLSPQQLYEQEQIMKARHANQPIDENGNYIDSQQVQPIVNQPVQGVTPGVYVTQPTEVTDEFSGSDEVEEPISDANNDVTTGAPLESGDDTKFPEVP